MNKKKLITMGVSLAMVAMIGIGATLAYMTHTTGQENNTFTVGRVDASLIETNKEGDPWDDKVDGKNLYPGQSVVKKPVMTIEEESSDAYAFLQIEGADALIKNGFIITSGLTAEAVTDKTPSAVHANWIKVKGGEKTLDGVYRFSKILEKSGEARPLDPIFDLVTYSQTQEGAIGSDSAKGKITIIGCAIQAEGVSETEAAELVSFEPKQ